MKMKKGFTLIELLIVISIIGILSSIILGSVNIARVRGLDARIQADMHNIQLGMQLFYDSNKRMPTNQTPGSGYCNSQANFLSDVVNAGYLPRTIQTPVASDVYYCYYDYGEGNLIGGLIVATLQAAAPTTGEYPGTCRPWSPNTNWCSTGSNTYYCLCNPYYNFNLF